MYALYGKGPEDKRFAALDKYGIRVSKKADAYIFDTKEEAENYLVKHGTKTGCSIEVRKV